MTEKEFDQQVWRRYDTVTLDTGIETTIVNVCFSTRSVRIFIKNAPPEWMPCNRIVGHKTRFGGEADDMAIIEELHNRVIKQADDIERLKNEKKELDEKLSKNHLKELLTAVNVLRQGIQTKKSKMEQVEKGLESMMRVLEEMDK
jgi:hypothetical protein